MREKLVVEKRIDKVNRQIILSENSGFCFGVKRALEKTMEQISRRKAEFSLGAKPEQQGAGHIPQIYTLGPLIHNKTVIDDLMNKGVYVLDDIDDAQSEDVVIVRSHGQGANFYEIAKERKFAVVDATCPFVSRIHKLACDAHKTGKQVVIIGAESHPEVIGINGWCENNAVIINNPDEIHQREPMAKLLEKECFVVCQTTLRIAVYNRVLKELDNIGIKYQGVNTICNATKARQDSCQNLAKHVDAMIVLGDKNSSNSRKLFEIAEKNCKKAFFAENINDLPLQQLMKYYKIGIAAGASTPETVIKEVIANMSEKQLENNVQNPMESFMDEIDASLKLPRNGEIIEGKVHMVTNDEVIVNIGCKKDGILPKSEVSLKDGEQLTDLFHDGDEIQAKVIKTGDDDGGILLSKKSLEVLEHWNELVEAYENKEDIKVKVIKSINSGAIAAYKDISGFIPMSQLANRYVESADEYVGQEFDVRVIRTDIRKQRVIFSRKVVLKEERQNQVKELWENLHEGDIIEGKVMRFTDFGAFVDIGGIDGLLHISEISWGKLKHPKEMLSLGETINVKVLSMNEENGRISLGLKQTTPEPWSIIDDKLREGDIVRGKVVQLKDYGAFIEIEAGLDGLVHISEISRQRTAHTSDVLKVGQIVYAKVIGVDKERKRISLSLRDTLDYTEDGDSEDVNQDYYFKTEEGVDLDAELAESTQEMSEDAAAHSNAEGEIAETTLKKDRDAEAKATVEGHFDSTAEQEAVEEVVEEDQAYYLEDAPTENADIELANVTHSKAEAGGKKVKDAEEIGKHTVESDEKDSEDKLACDAYLQNKECE